MPKTPNVMTQLVALRERIREAADQAGALPNVYIQVSELLDAAEALLEGAIDERIIIALDTLSAVLEDDLASEHPAITEVGRKYVKSA